MSLPFSLFVEILASLSRCPACLPACLPLCWSVVLVCAGLRTAPRVGQGSVENDGNSENSPRDRNNLLFRITFGSRRPAFISDHIRLAPACAAPFFVVYLCLLHDVIVSVRIVRVALHTITFFAPTYQSVIFEFIHPTTFNIHQTPFFLSVLLLTP